MADTEVPQVRFCPESGMLHRLMGDGSWAVLDVVGPADDASTCVPLSPLTAAAELRRLADWHWGTSLAADYLCQAMQERADELDGAA